MWTARIGQRVWSARSQVEGRMGGRDCPRERSNEVVHIQPAFSALQPGSLQVAGQVFSAIWRQRCP